MSASPKPLRFDPAEMALRGRIGAHVVHARYDARATTARARAAALARFEKEVPPATGHHCNGGATTQAWSGKPGCRHC